MCNINGPIVIGKIELPDNQPVKYTCEDCGQALPKSSFSWMSNVCNECQWERMAEEDESASIFDGKPDWWNMIDD
jgi:Zn finger protein HypA/HybF involved in hydrogenase expression